MIAVADTHSIIWYLAGSEKLSAVALQEFESAKNLSETIGISSITVAEMVYLHEKRRIAADSLQSLITALSSRRSILEEVPLNNEIAMMMQQIPREQIPDLPDRIIAASALFLGIPVISRDRKIQASQIQTIW